MKKIIVVTLFFLAISNIFAQSSEEDINALSIFSEYVKAKNYDSAYQPWMELRERSPKFNSAIYVYGERILKHKINNSSAGDKVKFINTGKEYDVDEIGILKLKKESKSEIS